MQCPSLLQTVLHTRRKNALFDFVTDLSHTHGSCVTSVEKEEPGLVDGNLRLGDVPFNYRGQQVAVDVFSVDSGASTNMGKCVEDLFVEAADGKQALYAEACADQDVTFFTSGADLMGRMSECAELFIRWLCNCVPDSVGGRSRLVHYWSRRVVVASMIGKMDMLLKHQRSMSPYYSRVGSLAMRLAPCDMHMRGGTRGFLSNRGRRRDMASFPRSVCVSVPGGDVGSR